MQENDDLRNMRLNYEQGQLLESNIVSDPFLQFKKWFDLVLNAKVIEPNAMTMATSTKDGVPSARVVLLKGFDESGFIFFTNYGSRKGQEITENPVASALFWWREFERQVRIEGKIEKISRAESEKYFNLRPLKSRYGALASNQSEKVENREVLEKRFAEFEKQFGENPAQSSDIRQAWLDPAFEPFRTFSKYPVLQYVDHTETSFCYWFYDLRFKFPELPPSFIFGLCRQNSESNWQMVRHRGLFYID